MNDIHALSGAYAVDALDDDERARFEEHLVSCAECRAEVDSLREASALLGDVSATPPPPSVRDNVLAGIREVRPLPPVITPSTPLSLDARRRRRLPGRGLLAAASVLLAVGVGAAVVQPWQDDASEVQVTAADRVLRATDATRTSLTFPDGATATVVRSVSEGKAVIVTEDMPPPPNGKVYELWLQTPEGEMVPAGLMPPSPDQTFLLEGDAGEAMAAGITIEPVGGSPQPTTSPIALFDLEQAT